MAIIEKTYNWRGILSRREKTDYIILHHSATSNASPDDIHRMHLGNGWTGIGYHFYVRKDGGIYRARPIDTVGAHTLGYNSCSVGICFEGNFETEEMNEGQLLAGRELIKIIRAIYPLAKVKKHKDFGSTACPGKNFPFDKIISEMSEFCEVKEIVKSLFSRGIMTDVPLWENKCASNENAYWLARKICNMTKNISFTKNNEKSAEELVSELGERGIILDADLWIKLFKEDKNLYWLGFKAADMTENGV